MEGLCLFYLGVQMGNKIILDLDLFKFIVDKEMKKLTGKTMKRFELSNDVQEIKKQVKEIQYEWGRDFYNILETGKIIIDFTKSKEGEKNG